MARNQFSRRLIPRRTVPAVRQIHQRAIFAATNTPDKQALKIERAFLGKSFGDLDARQFFTGGARLINDASEMPVFVISAALMTSPTVTLPLSDVTGNPVKPEENVDVEW